MIYRTWSNTFYSSISVLERICSCNKITNFRVYFQSAWQSSRGQFFVAWRWGGGGGGGGSPGRNLSRTVNLIMLLMSNMFCFMNISSTMRFYYRNKLKLQSYLSIADTLYSGHLVIPDTFFAARQNPYIFHIIIPLYSGHLYSGHLVIADTFFGVFFLQIVPPYSGHFENI